MRNTRNILSVLLISCLCFLLWFIPNKFDNCSSDNQSSQEKAKVIEINNEGVQYLGLVTTGTQEMRVKILSGKYDGQIVSASNILYGQKKRDNFFKKGDIISLMISYNENSDKPIEVAVKGYYRLSIILLLFFVFSVFLILFAGWTGVKALLSFIFTALCIWRVLIPSFLLGYNPFLISIITVLVTTSVIIFLVAGLNKKACVAFLGAVSGFLLTACLAFSFGAFFNIPGGVMEFSETLMYAGYQNIDFSTIFLSCIFISATGAVMDIAMDISASQNEIYEKNRSISCKELMCSGFKIGRPVIGTMTTTLLFAYSGSFMVVFMAFVAKGIAFSTIININYISAEILNVLVGSFGLVLVAPVTAIIGGILYTHKS